MSKSKLATQIMEALAKLPHDQCRAVMDRHETAAWIASLADKGLVIPTGQARVYLEALAQAVGVKR